MNGVIARKYLGRGDGRLFYEPEPNAEDAWHRSSVSFADLREISTFTIEQRPGLVGLIERAIKRGLAAGDKNVREIAETLHRSMEIR
jgi:hypothetical protein